ncbi:MAG: hypothetical protein GF355_05435, partial [Candidatus Eisenbacteria bacterium]|nr:hypothetical protein [Candidatus Eisenbacteria bacterium]
QINYGTTYYFNEAHGIYSHTYLYPESGSHDQDIIQDVSNGVAYVNYTAHGSQTSWSDPNFTQGDVNNLQNSGKYCTAVGNCCLTSTYDYGECFAETWLRAADKGAIGYIGGSNSTYWDEDYWWGVGYTSSIVSNPTYEQSGLGAYDGVFHDHGESMNNWYVVNDALIFCGNLAVMESGSSLTTYYWNIYNLMGDPSISTYLGVPEPNPVVHPETIFTTWTSMTVEAVPGSYVGLTREGELIGAGTVGESGILELPLWPDPLEPGSARLVVMAQNREPYAVDLNIIVPATVYIDPTVIDAGVPTDISVGVFEMDGVTPKPGIEVWADGLDYESVHAFTDDTGYCTISVDYPYGPSLDIVGKDPAESWELFREAVEVDAQMMFGAALWVTTEIGLNDSFALNLPGVIHANVPVAGHTLWALLNGEPLASTSEDSLEVTPTELGQMTGIIAVPGYDLVSRNFPVIEAYGQLTGHVDASGSPAAGAVVQGFNDLDELVFEATADSQGDYDVGEDILVAPYTVTVDYFGYLPWEEEFFVNYGANELNVSLDPAPSGVVTGVVTEVGTGAPLEASVQVYRADTMELYTETTSDPADGSYTTPALPYFDYVMEVKAWHHIPATADVTIDQPTLEIDFELEETIGNLLVVDDSAKNRFHADKVDEKAGGIVSPAYESPPGKAAADLIEDLENLGYYVVSESVSDTDPATWEDYDLLIVCSGDNTSDLGDAAFRNQLVAFVAGSGHLLIEGGEIGYNHYGEQDFAETVLHITDWDHDNSGNITVAAPDHYIMSVPNEISGPVSVGYSGYGDQDAVDVTTDAVKVGSWTSYPVNASLIAYDPNPAPEGGQIAYYAFNYSAMDAQVRPLLLQNTVTWLTAPESGDCTISGTAQLAGQTDHSGITVEVRPAGPSIETGPDGSYVLEGVFHGTCTVAAFKEGWSTETQEVELEAGEEMTGVDFLLTEVFQAEACEQPDLPIPDNNPSGVSDEMEISIGASVSMIEVYVDITHTYI